MKTITISEDKYTKLSEFGDEAKVAVTWGRTGPYGDPKISVMVSLTCAQKQSTIDEAGFLAYSKAKEIVEEVVSEFESGDKK